MFAECLGRSICNLELRHQLICHQVWWQVKSNAVCGWISNATSKFLEEEIYHEEEEELRAL